MPSTPKTGHVWVVVARGKPPVQCRLSYSSRNAGHLIFENKTSVPDRFAIYNSLRSNRGRLCRVTWRSDNEVRFEFLTREKLPWAKQE